MVAVKNPARKEDGSRRAREALAMREQGKTFREIGEHFGVSQTRAAQMVARGTWEKAGRRWGVT